MWVLLPMLLKRKKFWTKVLFFTNQGFPQIRPDPRTRLVGKTYAKAVIEAKTPARWGVVFSGSRIVHGAEIICDDSIQIESRE